MIKSKEHQKDKLIKDIYSKVLKISNLMNKEKNNAIGKIQKYLNGNNITLDECGNITLVNSAGTIKIQFVTQEYITLDEKIETAKKIIDKCIEKWSFGAKKKDVVIEVIKKAFNIEKKGAINKNAILKLTKLDIKDQEWEKAMKLILESIQILNKKQYMIIYERKNKKDAWQRINLNWSAI